MKLKTFSTIVLCSFIQITLMAQTYWSSQTNWSPKWLRSIKAVDSNVVWACGDSGIVFRTINGGVNWELTNAPDNSLNCNSIEAVNADTAWVVSTNELGGNTILYKTTDGGISWRPMQSSNLPSSFYDAVKFYDNDNGLFYGDPENGYFAIYTTENGGETWTRTDSSKIPQPDGTNEFGITNNLAISGNNAWFGTLNSNGENARIFYSKDRGKTWSAISIQGATSINAIAFSNELNGIIVFNSDKIGYSRDGGLNWVFPSTITLWGEGLCSATSSSFIIVGGSSYVSTDGGVTWSERGTNITTSLIAVSFANSSDGWAVSTLGVILKWVGGPLPDLPLSVEEYKNKISSNFELKQNYPNPFNPITTISYSIPKGEDVVLKVFDNLGREIKTLVNEYKNAGEYSIEFKASNLPSGIYFYRIEAGNFVKTKKLLLIK